MSRQMWSEAVHWVTADGPAIANTVADTALFPPMIVPANYMNDGRTLRLRAFGRMSTGGVGVWQTMSLRWGGVSSVLLAYGAYVVPASMANLCWSIELIVQTRLNGSAGQLFAMGDLTWNLSSTTSWASAIGSGNYQNPAAVTCNLVPETNMYLVANWTAALAANTITGHILVLESLN